MTVVKRKTGQSNTDNISKFADHNTTSDTTVPKHTKSHQLNYKVLTLILIILILICTECISLVTTKSLTFDLYKRYTMKYLTVNELAEYDGTDLSKPIYVSFKQHIFDVSTAPHYYSKNGSYPQFAGVDATRNYATGCFDKPRITHDTRGLSDYQVKQIDQWLDFYLKHQTYEHIGYLVTDPIDVNDPLPDDNCHGPKT